MSQARFSTPQLAKMFKVSRWAMRELLLKYCVPCHIVFTGAGALRLFTLKDVRKILTRRMKRRRKVLRKLP